MNKIVLIGNLTHDPETRATPTGVTVCSFTIAVNRRFAEKGKERQTDFFRINAWRQLGALCEKYLAKGRKVAVIGELQARQYDAKDGTTRMSLDVAADEIEFLSPKVTEQPEPVQTDVTGFTDIKSEQTNSDASGFTDIKSEQTNSDASGFTDIKSEDIPF